MNHIMKEIILDVKKGKNIDEKALMFDGESLKAGWHNPHFPPELRKACLRGSSFTVDESTYLYTVLSKWYEKISGKKAPCNFQVYGRWKKILLENEYLKSRGTEAEIRQFICAIEAGTCFKKENRTLERVMRAFQGRL